MDQMFFCSPKKMASPHCQTVVSVKLLTVVACDAQQRALHPSAGNSCSLFLTVRQLVFTEMGMQQGKEDGEE